MTNRGLTCRDLVEFIADYLDGALTNDQRAAFEEHLAACRWCRAYLHSYETTIRLSKAVGEYDAAMLEEAPDELVQAILEARRR